jgi:hypothetical protein
MILTQQEEHSYPQMLFCCHLHHHFHHSQNQATPAKEEKLLKVLDHQESEVTEAVSGRFRSMV